MPRFKSGDFFTPSSHAACFQNSLNYMQFEGIERGLFPVCVVYLQRYFESDCQEVGLRTFSRRSSRLVEEGGHVLFDIWQKKKPKQTQKQLP